MKRNIGDPQNASHRVAVKLVCFAKDKILLLRAKGKKVFNLVGGGVNRGETLVQTIKREFLEETGHNLGKRIPTFLHIEIKHFPLGGQFDSVVNIFYKIDFTDTIDIVLENADTGIYEEFRRVSLEELKQLAVSKHSNKKFLMSFLGEHSLKE